MNEPAADADAKTVTKQDKQREAILYAIKMDKAINRTKLMKYVFFVDLFAYNKFDNTMLEDTYKRLPNGPVPEYGMNYTSPQSDDSNREFQMEKKCEEGGYYYYKFSLADKVEPKMEIFGDVELDLLNLTLEMVQSHTANYLSDYTHDLDLWRGHENGDAIKASELRLSPDDMEDLERLLHTKIYVNSVNPKGFLRKIWEGHTDSVSAKNEGTKPKRLPVFVDVKTGDVIE